MSELTLTVIQLGFLAVLWLFVVTALSVMRTDIFGARGAYQGEQGGQGGGRATGQQAAEAAAQSAGPAQAHRHRRCAPGTSLSLTEAGVSVGRSPDSTLVLSDDYASTRHARLFEQRSVVRRGSRLDERDLS